MAVSSPSPRQPARGGQTPGRPFASAAEAWFWYMTCHQARLDGARIVAGAGSVGRPCEPADIRAVVVRLYHAGRLHGDHLRVMVRYGRGMLPPDPTRPALAKHARHWDEAMARLEPVLRAKGIVA